MKPIKVLSIGYVGHRKGSRLSRDGNQISQDLNHVLEMLQAVGQRMFNTPSANALFVDGDVSIRAIGGVAEGADRLVLQALKAQDISPTIINSAFPERDDPWIEQKTGITCSSTIRLNFDGRFAAHEEIIQSRCDVLVAIWDGNEAEGQTGGTVRAIRNAVSFGIPVIWVHAKSSQEVQLIVRKQSDLVTDLEKNLHCPCKCRKLNEKVLEKAVQKSVFISATAIKDKGFSRYLEGASEWPVMNWLWDKAFRITRGECKKLFGLSVGQDTNQKNSNHDENDAMQPSTGLHQKMNHADQISINMANRYRVSVMSLYLLSAFAVFWAAVGYVFEEALHHFSEEYLGGIHLAGWAEVGVILLIIGWLFREKRRSWHALWIHTRYLAEMLRMHALLQPVMGVASFMLRHDIVTSNWAHWLYRRYSIASPLGSISIVQDKLEPHKSNIQAYLQDQIQYHDGKIAIKSARHNFFHRGGYALFLLTLFAALAHLAHLGGHELAPWLTMITIVFPALGAAFHAILVQEEVERLIEASQAMKSSLEDLKISLGASADITAVRKKSIEAANLMANDALNWHQIVGLKKLELPA